MRNWIVLFLVGALATPALADATVSQAASANNTVNLYDRRDIAKRAPTMPLADATAIAVRRVPGTVLAAAIETNDGLRTWQIDILATGGKRVRLWLNASNGDVLKTVER